MVKRDPAGRIVDFTTQALAYYQRLLCRACKPSRGQCAMCGLNDFKKMIDYIAGGMAPEEAAEAVISERHYGVPDPEKYAPGRYRFAEAVLHE